MVSKEVASLRGHVDELLQDMQSLKSCQDMMFVKQDRIQSTLAQEACNIWNIGKKTAPVCASSPGFISPPTPNVVVTLSVRQTTSLFTSPAPSADLTQQVKVDSIPKDNQQDISALTYIL